MFDDLRNKKAFICDMDGVIYHGNNLLQGAESFVRWLDEEKKEFIFLTNSSERSPAELCQKLRRMGLDVPAERFYTSALATASFLDSQMPGGSAYVIGEAGIINALYDAGYAMNDVNPDYVVVGESRTYSIEKIEKAVQLVLKGARLIGTNPDLTGPSEKGIVPATRALIAPIEMATGRQAYFIGKPNPLIMKTAKQKLGVHSAEIAIIGDRMDTDIIAGIESGMDTVLVLSGVTSEQTMGEFPYRPKYCFAGVGEMVEKFGARG